MADKATDVRAKTADELSTMLLDLRKEQFNLRFQRATGQLENTARVRVIRRDIARMKTIAAQKRAGSMPDIAPQPKAQPKAKVAKPKAEKPKTEPKSKKPQSAKSRKAGAKKTAAKKSK